MRERERERLFNSIHVISISIHAAIAPTAGRSSYRWVGFGASELVLGWTYDQKFGGQSLIQIEQCVENL